MLGNDVERHSTERKSNFPIWQQNLSEFVSIFLDFNSQKRQYGVLKHRNLNCAYDVAVLDSHSSVRRFSVIFLTSAEIEN